MDASREGSILVLAIADDLTGALEVGAKFGGQGIDVSVSAGPERQAHTVVVIDTETRHLPPESAAASIQSLAESAPLIYKKTDSTLRGNIGAELGALLAMYPSSPLIYAPAYPQMGRTVTQGCLHVHGEPAHRTVFAADALNPVIDSDIGSVLRAQTGAPIFSIRAGDLKNLTAGAIYVVDGESDADIRETARAVLAGCRLAAGPAALASAIAAQIDLPRNPVPPRPRLATCLVINGSRHELSSRQVCHAKELGWPADPGSGWSILNSSGPADSLASVVSDILSRVKLDALTIFGGDTAYAILQSIGNPPLHPLGEIVPGVAVSQVEGGDLYLITKAGGFGPVDVLSAIRSALGGNS